MSNRQQLIAALILGGLLAVGAFAAMGTGVTAQESDTGSTSDEFVRVSASGSVDAEPDAVTVSLAVQAENDDPTVARQEVANGVEGMRQALNEVGISDDNITSTEYSLSDGRRHRPGPEEEERPEHIARHEFEVTVNNPDRAGEIIDAGIDSGATSVSGVSFTFSEDRRQELKQDALQEAMENARSQADAASEAGGISVTGVRSVSTTDTGYSPVSYGRAAFEEDAASTQVDPGPVEVESTVEVVYDVSS